MNRRGFISGLAAILSAATAPNIMALEAFDRFKWKVPAGGILWGRTDFIINPEWVNAAYEIQFFDGNMVSIPHPVRFATLEDARSNINWIPTWIAKEG
jgi:hypothetical protein